MSDRYILDHSHHPVSCDDLRTWARWMETADRVVIQTTVREGLVVSTVFLGLNHRFGPGTPLLFETMVFRHGDGGDEERYATWDEAVAGHQRMVDLVTQEPVDA